MAEEQSANEEARSLEVIYALAIRQLDQQLREIESVDTKLGLIVGSASVVIGLLLTSLPPAGGILETKLWALLIPIAFYVGIIVLGIYGYRFLSLNYPPDVGRVYEDALFWEPDITKRQVLSNWVSAIDYNRNLIAGKVKFATIALYLLPLEAVTAIGAGVLIHLP